MPRPILQSDKLQRDFDDNGFVVVKLLNTADLDQLQSVFDKYFKESEINSFTSTNIIESRANRMAIAAEIEAVIKPALNSVFTNTKFWNPAFLIKPVGENTEFKLHQDWTFVDENNYYSGNVWMPLIDTTIENGTICNIPKSHYGRVKTLRSQTIPEVFRGREDVLKGLSVPVDIRRGEAIIFQHSLVHYTPPNNSDRVRIAVTCGFNSSDATLLTHYKAEDGSVSLYEMPDNFVFDYGDVNDLDLRPANGKLLGPVEYKAGERMSDQELVSFFTAR